MQKYLAITMNSSEWFQQSYKLLNKNYEIKQLIEEKKIKKTKIF